MGEKEGVVYREGVTRGAGEETSSSSRPVWFGSPSACECGFARVMDQWMDSARLAFTETANGREVCLAGGRSDVRRLMWSCKGITPACRLLARRVRLPCPGRLLAFFLLFEQRVCFAYTLCIYLNLLSYKRSHY